MTYQEDTRFPGLDNPTRKDFLRGLALLASGAAFMGPMGAITGAMAQGAPKKGGVLAFNLSSSPPNFDPLSNVSSTVLGCIAPCYSGLVRFDPMNPDAIISDAAKIWTISPDGKTYTFKLFDNIKFHDGKPLTSADALFSLERMRNPPQGVVSSRKALLANVESIAAPDATTLVITLKRPATAFLNTLASGWMVILAKHFIEAGGDPFKTVMGSGPFKFKQYIEGVSVELVRNPDYFVADRPYLDGLKAFIVPDQGAVWNYLQAGQLHMWVSIQGSEAGNYKSDAKINIIDTPSTSAIGVSFNTTAGPFTNLALRNAAALAIDREAALNILQRGQGVFGGPVVPGPWTMDPKELQKIPGYGLDKAANLAEAKRIMKEPGFEKGGLKVRLLVRRIALFEPVGVFLKDQWSKIGIETILDVQENASFFTSQAGKKFDAVVAGISVNTSDPDDLGPIHACNSSQNLSGLCNVDNDKLFAQISEESDPVKRKQLTNQWEASVAAGQNMFVMYWRQRFMGLRRNVNAMVIHPNIDNNSKMQDVWLS